MRIRINKIWWMEIRVQSGFRSIKSPNWFQCIHKKPRKKKYFQPCTDTLENSYFLRFRLEKYNFLRKKTQNFVSWILLFLSFYTSGSGSPDQKDSSSDRIRIHIFGCDQKLGSRAHLLLPSNMTDWSVAKMMRNFSVVTTLTQMQGRCIFESSFVFAISPRRLYYHTAQCTHLQILIVQLVLSPSSVLPIFL